MTPPVVGPKKKPDPAATAVPEKKPELEQPQTIAVQPTTKPIQPTTANSEIAVLEQQLARYRSKSTLNTVLGAGAVVGGIITFVVVNGAYGNYKSQLDGTNTAYTSWYTQNYQSAPSANDLAQPKGLFQFGSPGDYGAVAAIVGGAILTIIGRKNASLARQTAQELKQKQISVTPMITPTIQLAGIHLRMTF